MIQFYLTSKEDSIYTYEIDSVLSGFVTIDKENSNFTLSKDLEGDPNFLRIITDAIKNIFRKDFPKEYTYVYC